MMKIEERPDEEMTFRDAIVRNAGARPRTMSPLSRSQKPPSHQKVPSLRIGTRKIHSRDVSSETSFLGKTTAPNTEIALDALEDTSLERSVTIYNNASRSILQEINESDFGFETRSRKYSNHNQTFSEDYFRFESDINQTVDTHESLLNTSLDRRNERGDFRLKTFVLGNMTNKSSQYTPSQRSRCSSITSSTKKENIGSTQNPTTAISGVLTRILKSNIKTRKGVSPLTNKQELITLQMSVIRRNFYIQAKARSYQGIINVLLQLLQYSVNVNIISLFLSTLLLLAETASTFKKINESFLYYSQLRIAGCHTQINKVKIKALMGLAEICKINSNYECAATLLRTALMYSWDGSLPKQEIAIYDALGVLNFTAGDITKAQFYHNKSISGELEPSHSAIRRLYQTHCDSLKGRFQKHTTLSYTLLSKFNLPTTFYIVKNTEVEGPSSRRNSPSSRNASRSKNSYLPILKLNSLADDTVEVQPERSNVAEGPLELQMRFIMLDREFETQLPTPRVTKYSPETKIESTTAFRVFVNKREHQERKPFLLGRDGLVKDNLKKSLQQQIRERLANHDSFYNFDDLAKNKGRQEGSVGLKCKLLTTHLAVNRNINDSDLMFQRATSHFEKCFKKMVKKLTVLSKKLN